jgi:flagellar protein FlaG
LLNIEKAKGVAMESVAVAPKSVSPTISKPSTPSIEPKVEIKSIQPTKVDSTLEKSADLEYNQKELTPKEIVNDFNNISNDLNLDVKFAYNEKIGEMFISVTNKSTGEIIRKLPSEEAMKIKESMQDLIGVLFDKKG